MLIGDTFLAELRAGDGDTGNDGGVSRGPAQLLLYVGGVGGTGKTRVIEASRDLFRCYNRSSALVVSAYMGGCAAAQGGRTMHSTVCIQPEAPAQGLSDTQTTELQAKFRNVLFNFIDEVSMVSAWFLQAYHTRLCLAKEQAAMENAIPFGGLHMVFFGDFAQYPPVKQTALWKAGPSTTPSSTPTVNNEPVGPFLCPSFFVSTFCSRWIREARNARNDQKVTQRTRRW